jgi:hypothetical protein
VWPLPKGMVVKCTRGTHKFRRYIRLCAFENHETVACSSSSMFGSTPGTVALKTLIREQCWLLWFPCSRFASPHDEDARARYADSPQRAS